MGISGLLQALAPLAVEHKDGEESLAPFKGKKLAVDLSAWLYKGAYGCASDLALGKPTRRYLDYVLHRLRMLRFHGVEAVLVADGQASGLKVAFV